MKKNDISICSAYMCPSAGTIFKHINGSLHIFCADHIDLMTHSQSAVVLELVSNSRVSINDLICRINFSLSGYTKKEFLDTIDYLVSIDELVIIDDTLLSSESESNCDFYGCKLKKRDGSVYCANHKVMPPVVIINDILTCIKLITKNVSQICSGTGISSGVVRSTMAQLLKFGYVTKEKRGVTNYYMAV